MTTRRCGPIPLTLTPTLSPTPTLALILTPTLFSTLTPNQVWANKWREEVRLGIVPYYMFVARDTGAQAFFNVPLVRAQKLYADAIRSTSGLCRTARGPSMSCTPGKIEVTGVQEIMGQPAFILRFLQCRDEEWIGKVIFAKLPLASTQP